MKHLILAALLAVSGAAFAQSTATTDSMSHAETRVDGNGVVTINQASAPAMTAQRITHSGLPVSTPGTSFVNPPSNDTCNNAGDSVGIQAKVFGFTGSKGGDMQVACDVRSRALNAKATGQSATVVAMILCQDPNTAQAFNDAADLEDAQPGTARKAFRCPSKDKAAKPAPVATAPAGGPNMADPYIAARGERMGWSSGYASR